MALFQGETPAAVGVARRNVPRRPMHQPAEGIAELPAHLGTHASSKSVSLWGQNSWVPQRIPHLRLARLRRPLRASVHGARCVLLSALAVAVLLLSCSLTVPLHGRRGNSTRRLAGKGHHWELDEDDQEIIRLCMEMEEATSQATTQSSNMMPTQLAPTGTPFLAPPRVQMQDRSAPFPPASSSAYSFRSASPVPPVPHPGAFMWGDLGTRLWDVAVRNSLVVLEDTPAQLENPERERGEHPIARPHAGPPRLPFSPAGGVQNPHLLRVIAPAAPSPSAATVVRLPVPVRGERPPAASSMLGTVLHFYNISLQNARMSVPLTPLPQIQHQLQIPQVTSPSTIPPSARGPVRRRPLERPEGDGGIQSKRGRLEVLPSGPGGGSQEHPVNTLGDKSAGEQAAAKAASLPRGDDTKSPVG